MKKLLSILLVLTFCLGLAACTKVEDELVGKYAIQSQTEDGVTLNLDSLKLSGMDKDYIEIKKDGTVIFVNKGVAQEGKIDTKDKTMTFAVADEELDFNYNLEGDILTFDDGAGFKITYKKQ